MTASFNYIALNNQMSLSDDINVPNGINRFEGPEDFDEGTPEGSAAFLKDFADKFDLECFATDVKFWDGRTMVVSFADDESLSMITFVFEAN